MNSKEEFSLEPLINFCCDAGSPQNGRAWTVLLERFQKYIYKVISRRCKSANIKQINLNFSDTVNEIYHEVIIRLCKDDGKALREFRHKDKERVFLSYLAMIANSAATYFITKNYFKQVSTIDIDDLTNYLSGMAIETRSLMYEDQVKLLRASVSSAKNIERDINIFTLSLWHGFNLEMLLKVPCLQQITEGMVRNTLHRMRKYLSENRDLLN